MPEETYPPNGTTMVPFDSRDYLVLNIPSARRRTNSTWDVRKRTDPAISRCTKRKASVLLSKARGSTSWKHSSGSPGHHHEGHLIIYRDINLYFTHIYRGQGEKEKEVEEVGERAKESEGMREEILFPSFSSSVFFFFVSLSPPIFFPLLPFPVMHLHPARLTPVAM